MLPERVKTLRHLNRGLRIMILVCGLAAIPVVSQDRAPDKVTEKDSGKTLGAARKSSVDSAANLMMHAARGTASGAAASPAIRFISSFPDQTTPARRKSFLERLRGVLFAQAEESLLVRPLGLAAYGDVLFVTDPGAGAVVIIDLIKNTVQRITRVGDDPLVSPVGIAVGQGRVYFSDSYLKRIFVYDLKSRSLKNFADRPMSRPTGVALAEKFQLLFVVDTGAHQVLAYGLDGKLQRSIGKRGRENGEFNFPTHAWLAADGTLWVVDSLNYRVQQFRQDGTYLAQFGRHGDGSGDFANPKGIAADSRGHLYVVDTLFDAVQVFDAGGQLLTGFGERGRGPGQLWLPNGMFIDGRDRIYIADSYNRRIQIFEYSEGADENP